MAINRKDLLERLGDHHLTSFPKTKSMVRPPLDRDRGLRIAHIGLRGVPATFGGVERHVEEIGARLVDRGHSVTVYCRRGYVDGGERLYRGMRLLELPTISSKHFDAIVHSFLSTVNALRQNFDVLHFHGLGPGVMAILPRLLGHRGIVLTVHGLDNERAKWGGVTQKMLLGAQWLSARLPRRVVAVSRSLQKHYWQVHHRKTVHIPNGTPEFSVLPARRIRSRLGLEHGNYLLVVARFVPEKSLDTLIRAFRQVNTDHRLVLAGGSCFSDDYVEELHQLAQGDPRILLPGYVYGEELIELFSNAAAFVQPSKLEGLPLTLLEAASVGVPLIVSDIGPHLEVVEGHRGPGVEVFPVGNEQALTAAMERLLGNQTAAFEGAAKLKTKVRREFNWDNVTERTEAVYRELANSAVRIPRSFRRRTS